MKGRTKKSIREKKKSGRAISSDRRGKGVAWLSCPIHGIEYDTSKGCPACTKNRQRI